MMIKCIKHKCKYYFSSDIIIKCQLADKYIKNEECIGINKIDSRLEGYICKISKIIDAYNKLREIERYIINNQ